MREHYRRGEAFRMTTRQEQSQDIYQFGTLAFRLACGSPLPTVDADFSHGTVSEGEQTSSFRFQQDVHPLCKRSQAASFTQASSHGGCTCAGCNALAELETH